MTLRFDSSEVRAYADLLVKVADASPVEARKVVAKGALNIKTDAKRRRSGSRYLPGVGAAITYETQETRTGAWAEIGPEHGRRQGSMGHIPEYGTPTNPPEPYMYPAGQAEEPRFERAMQDIAAKPLDR